MSEKSIKEPLVLTLGEDFARNYNVAAGETLPVGTTARIDFFADKDSSVVLDSWAASEVATSVVRFRVEKEEADLIADRTHYRMYVVFPETPNDFDRCWTFGDVKRIQ